MINDCVEIIIPLDYFLHLLLFLLLDPAVFLPDCFLSTTEPYNFSLCWDLLANLLRASVDI